MVTQDKLYEFIIEQLNFPHISSNYNYHTLVLLIVLLILIII